MVGIPAWVWRFGLIFRPLIVGVAVGIVFGLLALFGSNSVPVGRIVFVIIALLYSAIMGRRMAKFWPGAKRLSGADRVAVARVTRSGDDIGDARLAPTAMADTIFSPVGEAVVSWLYFVFFPIDLVVASQAGAGTRQRRTGRGIGQAPLGIAAGAA